MTPQQIFDCTILLVDDEEANLDLLEAFLGSEGYHSLVRTTDARQAIALFEQHSPDLVLLDLHMPYRSGFEVLRDIRERTPEEDYRPVLVLTADVTAEAKERALSEGARDFLTKPFDVVEVLLRVNNLLETRVLYRQQREARRRAEAAGRRAALLAEASGLLGTSLDHTTTLSQLSRLMVPGFADLSLVVLLDEAELVPVGAASARADDARPVQDLLQREASAAALSSMIRAGRTLLHSDESDGEASEALAELLEPVGARSSLLVPLGTGGRAMGALLLARKEARCGFDREDLLLAEQLGARAALAVENAQLFASAQAATQARERLLSVVAHDLRNPLALVAMGAEMMLELLPPAEDMYQRNMLSHVLQASQRMQRLIEDLLDLSRLEQGVFSLRPAPVAVAALFEEFSATFQPLAESRSIRLDLRGRDDLPPLQADSGRILQVLSNLVGNALKFTPEGGRVEVCWGETESGLRVSVADTGPGIAAEELPHVFGAFWQAASAERRGVGLGLWIARSIVEAHGGRIWVDSVVGRGTTFHFTLPWTGEPAAPEASQVPVALA